ncbi:MAG TPA: peptidylprolyl isomerase [Firmicutes bacterium]|nr:peptidylprolyl isomerase [Bacillota bacterium]
MKNITIILEDGRQMNARLYEDKAPETVANFLRLAQDKFYDGLCFHRVIPDFMIQGGGFESKDGALVHKPAPVNIKGEFAANGFAGNTIKHKAGVLSMARAMDKNSASSQFFICIADCPHLDGQYAAFGELSDEQSLDVALSIGSVPTGSWSYYDDVPLTPVVIKTVKAEENDKNS